MPQLSVPVGDRDHTRGSPNAPITLLDYGDYACPRCGQVYLVLQEIQKQVGDSLRFVSRHFPLTAIRPLALYAAELAEAAHTQGCFWQMHDYLLRHQQLWGSSELLRFVAELGLDVDRFEREVAEHVYAARVQADLESGVASGVNGTPTFFINGIRYDGRLTFEALLAAIELAAIELVQVESE